MSEVVTISSLVTSLFLSLLTTLLVLTMYLIMSMVMSVMLNCHVMSGDGIPVATHVIVMLSVSLTVICGSSIVANGETEETKKGKEVTCLRRI